MNKFHLTVRTKLYFIFSIMLFMMLSISGTLFYFNQKVTAEYKKIALKNYPVSLDLLVNAKDIRGLIYRLGIENSTSDDIERVSSKITEYLENHANLVKEYKAFNLIKEEHELFLQTESKWSQLEPLILKGLNLKKENKTSQEYYSYISNEFKDSIIEYTNSINELVVYLQNQSRISKESAIKFDQEGLTFSILIFSLGILISILITYLFIKNLVKNLSQMGIQLSKTSHDLSQKLFQMQKISMDVFNAAEKQISMIEKSNISLTQMTSMLEQTNKSVSQSVEKSQLAQNASSNGKVVMEQMISAMQGLRESNLLLAEVSDSIQEIYNNTETINSIVMKTQLLSFNASIEAARAGEHGTGFAVVAEEVGMLAKSSGVAAVEIENQIDKSSNQVNKTVSTIQERITAGENVTNNVIRSFNSILVHVEEINENINHIQQASEQQLEGVNQTNQAMNVLQEVSQISLQQANNVKSVMEDLDQQKNHLNELVEEIHKLTG